jgi:hypothetical protein
MASSEESSFDKARLLFWNRSERLTQLGHEIGYGIDKALIALAGGSLVFSMTLVNHFAPNKRLLAVLFGAWICFGVCILYVIAAMRSAQVDVARQATQIGGLLKEMDEAEAQGAKSVTPTLRSDINPVTARRNKWAVRWFVMGVVMLALFVGYNLWMS